jgi:hypothetical protein
MKMGTIVRHVNIGLGLEETENEEQKTPMPRFI